MPCFAWSNGNNLKLPHFRHKAIYVPRDTGQAAQAQTVCVSCEKRVKSGYLQSRFSYFSLSLIFGKQSSALDNSHSLHHQPGLHLQALCCPSLPPKFKLLKVTWFLFINDVLCSSPKSTQECICCLDQLWIPISAPHLQLKECVWKFTYTLLFPVGICISNYFLPDENTLPLKCSCFTLHDLRSGMICICCIHGTKGIRKTNVPSFKKKDAVSCQRKYNQIWIKEKLQKQNLKGNQTYGRKIFKLTFNYIVLVQQTSSWVLPQFTKPKSSGPHWCCLPSKNHHAFPSIRDAKWNSCRNCCRFRPAFLWIWLLGMFFKV